MVNHGLFFFGILVSYSVSFFSIVEVKFSRVASAVKSLATYSEHVEVDFNSKVLFYYSSL